MPINNNKKNIMIIAGEASGDTYGAQLVNYFKSHNNSYNFYGIGGDKMLAAGVDCKVHSKDIAVVGLVEVLKHYKVIKSALNSMVSLLKNTKPDLLILIDYPDFNLRLAQQAKKYNINVLYYISPQVWAWREKRVNKIRHCVDHMCVAFPFEKDFYEKHRVPVTFVGHPILDALSPQIDKKTALPQLGLNNKSDSNKSCNIIGLFPGSRHSEIKKLLTTLLKSAEIILQNKPNTQFIMPVASTIDKIDIENYLAPYKLPIKLVQNNFHTVIQACDAIVSTSGTATLEIALYGTPMVIINKLSDLTYFLIKKLVKVNQIGLCNIIANKNIVPELIQEDVTPHNIAMALEMFLEDQTLWESTRENLLLTREKLGFHGAAERVAAVAEELMGSHK